MPSLPPNPRLGKSTALNMAQSTNARLSALVPTLTTNLSPVTIYQPGVSGGVGNELLAKFTAAVSGTYGVWIAPDLNGDGSTYYVQVECFGAGGGAGGGSASSGGGGGGGGEYACEAQYPIVPGASYAYALGLPGSGGFSNSLQVNPGAAGTNGGSTVFDIAGLGLANGVVANGGQGGDQTAIGIGGAGGTGSANSIHFDGGAGGTNNSANGSDNPLSLAKASGMFVGNTLSTSIIPAWFILNDNGTGGGKVNDDSLNSKTGTTTGYSGSLVPTAGIASSQVPAYVFPSNGPLLPNSGLAAGAMRWKYGSLSQAAAKITTTSFGFSGTKLTVSAWIQPDPSGTWGNTAAGSLACVAANSRDYTSNSLHGYGLYLKQNGTPGSPSWQLTAAVGDGTHNRTFVNYNIGQTPGVWTYVVMTYNSGTLTLYINGSSVGTASSSGYSSVPGGGFPSALGLDPSASVVNWFFGYISNVWWANDCATAALVSQAFGTTPATGGAGGGASGGPSASGGNGAAAGGATGGAGGTPATRPASLATTTTAAQGGYAGSNAGSGNASPSAPAGGSYGGGGGGSGDMPANPTLKILTVPFAAAASYCGTDAASTPGAQYNTGQMTNPGSGLNSVLFAGGLPSDTDSGSKNSVLLLPKGLASQLTGSTIVNVFLTVTNAFPTNTVESILEIGYSADVALPQTYDGSSLVSYVAAIPVTVGAGTITYDMTPSGIGANIKNGTATALVMGPGSAPSFDAFNAVTGQQFYASVYGPGAADAFGNAEYPYLTIIYEPTVTTQQGSAGASGAILITAVTNSSVPVAFAEPFAGTDPAGNQYAQGFTGQITAWNPSNSTPGQFTPEVWHPATLINSWTGTLKYKLTGNNSVRILGAVTAPNPDSNSICFQLPAVYRPPTSNDYPVGWHITPNSGAFVRVDTSGNVNLVNSTATNVYLVDVDVPLDY